MIPTIQLEQPGVVTLSKEAERSEPWARGGNGWESTCEKMTMTYRSSLSTPALHVPSDSDAIKTEHRHRINCNQNMKATSAPVLSHALQ